MLKLFAVLCLTAGLAGCSTGANKQVMQQPSPQIDERPLRGYERIDNPALDDYEYTVSAGSYRKPVARTSSRQDAQLSTKQIQRALKNAGCYEGPIDGKIGPKTREAIRKFQKKNRLQPDGIVGKATSAELKTYLSK